MKAVLRQYRQSPRKVRLVADVVRGKSIERALRELSFLSKRSSGPIKKLIDSAVANAKTNDGKDVDTLYISSIMVDEGPTLRRHRPRAHGRAARINKRTSHITLILSEKGSAEGKRKNEKVKTTSKKVKEKETSTKKTSSKATENKETVKATPKAKKEAKANKAKS